MAAILGVVGSRAAQSDALIRQMHAALAFRGTQLATERGPGYALGASCHPYEVGPFLVANQAGTVFAVCEGELYNARDLARALGSPEASRGFEIVPALFEKRGKDFPREMNGIFTIALFDTSTRTLYLVRDHAGSHSLFYSVTGDATCFATTIPALFATGLVERRLSPSGLDGYLACLAISPPETIFERIMSIRPGHMAIDANGVTSEYCYWPFHAVMEDRTRSEEEFADEIRQVFTDAVKIRAAAPGTFGALISGGVDTTAIASILAQDASRGALHGFSIVFDELAYSDAALQEYVYRGHKVERHQLLLTPDAFREGLIAGAAHLDSPVNDVAYVGMYKAMQLVREVGLEAAFEGEGSDEIFCTGHSHGERSIQPFMAVPEWLRRSTLGVVFRGMPTGGSFAHKVRRFGCRLGMPTYERLSTWPPVVHNPLRRSLHPGTTNPTYGYPATRHYLSTTAVKDPINRYNYLLTRLFLADDLLYKNERMSAAHGITNRTPFIDYRLMELGFAVPARFKLQKPTATQDMTKLIFKKAMEGIVPEAILRRKKARGFSQPTSVWYRKDLKDFVSDLLTGPDSKISRYLDGKEIAAVWNTHVSGAANLDYPVNALVILELWMRSHL
ncbi:MAG: asparagine synthase-related protein [Acidobacteria bacterium]|nr:asparagine synthase-related protein [Acidobacteriota bacterium]